MIYLLAGTDSFRINSRVAEIIGKYKDPNDLNFIQLDEISDFAKFNSEATTLPFLAEKKILVVKNSLNSKNKDFVKALIKFIPQAPDFCIIIFTEDDIPKPTVLNPLLKLVKYESFMPMKVSELSKWIVDKVKVSNGKIGEATATRLAAMIGDDLYKAENEVNKLLAYNTEITDETVDKLITPDFNESIFILMDAISEKRPKEALNLINSFLDNDENEIYLLSMLSRQVKNLLIIKDLVSAGKIDSQIVSETGLHPYVVKKTTAQSKNFSIEKLVQIHESILAADVELKSTSANVKLILNKTVLNFTK